MKNRYRSAAAEGLFLFGIKKKQKMPAENFSFKASGVAKTVKPEKFVRPDLSRTEIRCYGLAVRKCICIASMAPDSGKDRSRSVITFFVVVKC